MFWMVTILVALVVVLLALTSHFYLQGTAKLTDKDTIVLADFANSTGDPVFDYTLKTALTVSLNQSPFLNVVSDNKVLATLKLMTRPPDTKLTPDVARDLCQRVGSKAYLAGSLASLGSQYVLGLKAVDCQSGDTLAQEQATAGAKEKVLDAVDNAAAKLRGKLGESLATVQRFDVPLAEATTTSLEALKAYSLGVQAYREKGAAAALPFHQRAIQIDPNFALGNASVGNDYFGLGELGRADDSTRAMSFFGYPISVHKLMQTCKTHAQSCSIFVYLQGCFRDGIARDERMAFGAEISNQKSLGFQVESLSKLATIFVSFCVLSCRILPLEDRKDQRAFLVGLVPTIPMTSRLEGIEQRPGHRNRTLPHFVAKISSLQLGSPMNFRRAAIPRRNSYVKTERSGRRIIVDTG
jgi:hypothetical protein